MHSSGFRGAMAMPQGTGDVGMKPGRPMIFKRSIPGEGCLFSLLICFPKNAWAASATDHASFHWLVTVSAVALLATGFVVLALLIFNRKLKAAVYRHTRQLYDQNKELLREVAERKEAEKKIRFQANLLNAVGQSVIAMDRYGAIAYMNPASEQLFGYDREDTVGRFLGEVAPFPAPGEGEVGVLERLMAGESWSGELVPIHRDGTRLPIEATCTPLRDENGLLLGIIGVFTDISQRKRFEEALQESLEKYRVLFNSFPLGITVTDRDGNILETNRMAEELLGIPRSEHEGRKIDGEQWRIVDTDGRTIPHEDYASARALKENRLVENAEMGVIRPDGRTTWITVTAAPVPLDQYGIVITYADITDRKLAEDAFKKSQRELQLTLDATTDGIWSWDFRTDRLFFSPRYYHMLGYEPEEFPATFENWKDLIHPEDRDRALATAARWLESKSARYENEFRMRAKGGEFRWIRARGKVVERSPQGEALRMIGSHEDVTDRRLVEESLRESEEKYRTLFESMAQGVFYQRFDGVLVDVNSAALEMFGLSRDEFLGRTSADPRWTVVDEKGSELSVDRHPSVLALKTGRPVRDAAMGIFNPAKERFVWMTVNAIPRFRPGKNTPYQVFVTLHDVSERKRAEEAMKAALEEKEILLRELYHRTKNNMQVIRSMLALQGAHCGHPEVKSVFKETENRIQAMALVHQKLYQSRDLSRINLKEYYNDLAHFLIRSYGAAGERITLRLHLEDIHVLIDTAIPCGLVLNELVSNALKHAFPDGREGEIVVEVFRSEGRSIEIRFSDNGAGVPEGFDLRTQGTLGLQTVLMIVEHQLKGKLEFSNKTGLTVKLRFQDSLYSKRV